MGYNMEDALYHDPYLPLTITPKHLYALLMVLKRVVEVDFKNQHLGLCRMALEAANNNIISLSEGSSLIKYIRDNRPSRYSSISAFKHRNDIYYWEPGDMKPRIKWLKKHIKIQRNVLIYELIND